MGTNATRVLPSESVATMRICPTPEPRGTGKKKALAPAADVESGEPGRGAPPSEVAET
jgi:hypothetical protein